MTEKSVNKKWPIKNVWSLEAFAKTITKKVEGQGDPVLLESANLKDRSIRITGSTWSFFSKLINRPILYLGSSHLPGSWKNQRIFRLAVRAVLKLYQNETITIICPLRSPIFELAKFVCFRQRWNFISIDQTKKNYESWLRDKEKNELENFHFHLSISKQHNNLATQNSIIDKICFALASEVRLLSVRKGGRLESLLPLAKNKRVFVLNSTQPNRGKKRSRLPENAVRWFVFSTSESQKSDTPLVNRVDYNPAIRKWKTENFDDFLFHHTRGTLDHWPSDSPYRFWEKWLWDGTRTGSAQQTLLNILSEQRIRGSGRLIPDKVPMVCFSENDPQETSSNPVFQNHLGRWDGLPFGVGLRKENLTDFDIRKVSYLDNSRVPVNTFEKGPWTHPQFTFDSEGNISIDWSYEKEHRLMGDIDLRAFSCQDVVVFVEKKTDAEKTAPFCRFPVHFLKEG